MIRQSPPSIFQIINREMLRTERHFRLVAMGAATCYSFLVWLCYYIVGNECAEKLQAEQMAATIACVCLTVSLLLQLLPIFLHKKDHPTFSGVVFAAVIIQLVALITNGIIAFGNAPGVIDQVTGARVSLLRWAEWIPLSFAMAFLVEGSNVPNQRFVARAPALLNETLETFSINAHVSLYSSMTYVGGGSFRPTLPPPLKASLQRLGCCSRSVLISLCGRLL